MTLTVMTALLSHWRRRPLQFLTLILGLALATALWSGVQAINAEARSSYDRAATVIGNGEADALVNPAGRISLETYVSLRRAGWRVSPVIEGWLQGDGGRVLEEVAPRFGHAHFSVGVGVAVGWEAA